MTTVLDTNVLVSGIFFKGPPYQILEAWRHGTIRLLVSPPILDEYRRVGLELTTQFPAIDLDPFWELLTVEAEMILAPTLPLVVPDDPSDNKFLECAVAGKATCIVSGDKHLLKLSRFGNCDILKPRDFLMKYLRY